MSELQGREVVMGSSILCSLLPLKTWGLGLRLGALTALQRPLAAVWCPQAEQTSPCPALQWVSREGNISSVGQSVVLITPGQGT